MPRHDDRYANTRLYVGHLGSRTRSRDLEYVFSKYGRCGYERDYAFVEFSDPRDADDARYHLDGKDLDGKYLGRGPPPGSGRCFNCGIDGHWARDCKAGDWKNKCYRCGERGHIERNCKNSPKKLKRGRSYSRSPARSRSPRRGRSRSPSYSRGRSYSGRDPHHLRETSVENEGRSLSPEPKNSPPSKSRKRSPMAEEGSPRPSPRLNDRQDRSEYSASPRGRGRGRSRSRSLDRLSPGNGRYGSPSQVNGRSGGSLSPRSPTDDDYENNRRPPRGSESP
ncbi:hypothetical protein K2173_002037 [Erythroxylum novogranatense]|uniref:Uncharacterized protein n=1 Tax=Erythroxylum novogranatense TaxID=1862640 RepID=A0AAV8SPM3_9ROSI|nr:hypothetical protein K2173_002037 [Erythroxylum novogranatense]